MFGRTKKTIVFVVNFDPDKMKPSPQSGMIGFDGEWFFKYEGGSFGIWPTKELLAEQTGITFDENGDAVIPAGDEYQVDKYGMVFKISEDGSKNMVAGNFISEGYLHGEVEMPTVPKTEPASQAVTVPAPATDPTSSTSDTPPGSNSDNNSNGAIATGSFNMVAIVLVVLIAGAGAVYFARKKVRK